jgi:hypothetical protein
VDERMKRLNERWRRKKGIGGRRTETRYIGLKMKIKTRKISF